MSRTLLRCSSNDLAKAIVAWAVLTAVPTPALAAFDTPCGASSYRGRVKRSVVTESKVDALTGAQVGQSRPQSEITFTEDGLTSHLTLFEKNSSDVAQSTEFPTITSEYNEAGLLVKEIYRLPGSAHQRTTLCQYDSQRRVVKETAVTANPETSRTIEFEYGDGWRRQHFKTSVASIVVTQTFDKNGNLIREDQFDLLTKSRRSPREFVNKGNQVESCSIGETGDRYCSTTQTDDYGNELEATSDGIYRRHSYEYDRFGNWTSKRTSTNSPLAEPRTNTVTRRSITYW